ncbi:transglycosylase domain-containing protein [Jeotgalibacillus sp. R-1-5s-1]|uniref:transglycosylase domain-containing protein n=1 Tax=Jeotgalibacillus sp. R-1-5s-1 TaxID=2555897 RepID=UPI00106C3E5C|nr:PBP1A family penicillin-binding protein [Jeotgalibacillus sp. R-1-5s-1]TFD92906.1 PBP1A family penicillin-binding protein [Jeotgalibacillus sp. R-1-5s-1]
MGRISRRRRRKRFRILQLAVLTLFVFSFLWGGTILALYFYAKTTGPPSIAVSQSTLILDANDEIIGERTSGEKRYWMPLEDISPHVVKATLAVEDRKFYDHKGFDFTRIAGAAIADIKAMAKVQGASTITQQYARNLYLTHDKTWTRKLNEALYTIRLEWNYEKEDILEGYLNTIYYGHGMYGIEAASRYYFGVSSEDLTLAQAAMLAGVPKSPYGYSPLENFDEAKERQELVLSVMQKNGDLSADEAKKAKKEELVVAVTAAAEMLGTAPYFQEAVWQELEQIEGLEPYYLKFGGLKIYTTLDSTLQKTAEETVAERMPAETELEVAFAAIDPSNGYVKAMVGGRNYENSPFNRFTQAKRQPGSTIKPILYTGALERGFTPATTMKSEPTTFYYDEGRSEYAPLNFNHKFANDAITLAQAIAISDNIYAVKAHQFLGGEVLQKEAKRFGLSTPVSELPSAALGTSEVVPLEMIHAYSVFANDGKRTEPVLIRKIEDADGKVIYEQKQKDKQALDQKTAFVMTHMLTGTFDPVLNDYSTVTGITLLDQKTREYAAKSGTTNSDQWMIGYSPTLTAGVWTGYDDARELTLSEDKAAAKSIWIDFMEKAHAKQPEKFFVPPAGVRAVQMDPHTGLLNAASCGNEPRTAYFLESTEPVEDCEGNTVAPPGEPVIEQEENENWLGRLFGE